MTHRESALERLFLFDRVAVIWIHNVVLHVKEKRLARSEFEICWPDEWNLAKRRQSSELNSENRTNEQILLGSATK